MVSNALLRSIKTAAQGFFLLIEFEMLSTRFNMAMEVECFFKPY